MTTTSDDNNRQEVHPHEDGPPVNRLTRSEIKEVREMLEADRRARWAWSTGRIWAAWLAGAIVGIYGLYDTLEKLLRRLSGH